jgi:ribonucleoside-triphosphate reductase (thioredoxin)
VYVKERFTISHKTEDYIRSLVPPFGYNGFGEFLFYRTYSRAEPKQEDWADTMIRAGNGVFSVRKDWYIKTGIKWDEDFWQSYAKGFIESMCMMRWMPPGRGLWAMGTDFIYERGSMALYNCAYTDITDDIGDDISWLMDSLMCGVGVGFGPLRNDKMRIYKPVGVYDYVIPDTREGWADSEKRLIDAFIKPDQKLPNLIYDKIRGPNLPIKGFGGISSGPEPLKRLHIKTIEQFEMFGTRPEYDSVYLKTNLGNLTGVAVVAGNVRRSAELTKGKISDPVFPDLKDYSKFPEREEFGWMSNNSVELETAEDFDSLGEIAQRVIRNGEPGYINRVNMPYGRIGKRMKGLRKDKAVGFNPCGEIPLEHREVCNLSETFPTMCNSHEQWLEACSYASLYCTTVSLLPTHQPSTNRVVARNRRIGVGIVDYTGWKHENGVHKVTRWMREGYKAIVRSSAWSNDEAGVPRPIRHTTVKPGGTTPKIPGKTSGVGHPTFDFTLRRVRVAKNSPVHVLLANAGVPYEGDYYDKYTDVFEWPIHQGPAQPADQVTVWEQAMNLIVLQREWSDNAVSNTLYFRPMWALVEHVDDDFVARLEFYFGITAASQIISSEMDEYTWPERYRAKCKFQDGVLLEVRVYEFDPKHEERDIEPVLSAIAPLTKSVSLLPHSPKGAYRQMPEEGITEAEYYRRLNAISPIDWSQLSNSDGIDERYCSGPVCEIPVP